MTPSSFDVALDGGRCTHVSTHNEPDCVGPYAIVPEQIAWLAIDGNVQEAFTDWDDKSILLETIQTPGNDIIGWSDGGSLVNFATTFATPPLMAAQPQTRNEADGGWFRFSGLGTTSVTLLVDEAVGDAGARSHNTIGEQAGLLLFSENFRVQDLDPDRDLVPIPLDNCPFVPNPSQDDLDNDNEGDACDCGDASVISNAFVQEDCDDGNNTDDDGCPAACEIEAGWECDTGVPTSCCLDANDNGLCDTDEPPGDADDGACGCRSGRGSSPASSLPVLLLLGLGWILARRRGRA